MGNMVDTGVYLSTAVLTILWSVWIYLRWMEEAGLPEDSPLRIFLMVAPSGYFLLMALAGWQKSVMLRLDLIGLLVLDGLTLLCWIVMLLVRALRDREDHSGYTRVIAAYHILAAVFVLSAHLIKGFPPLLIGLTNLIGQLQRIDLFSFAWAGLDPESHRDGVSSMLNKLLIALLTYLPISLLRAVMLARQRRRMQREIRLLARRVEALERARRRQEGTELSVEKVSRVTVSSPEEALPSR